MRTEEQLLCDSSPRKSKSHEGCNRVLLSYERSGCSGCSGCPTGCQMTVLVVLVGTSADAAGADATGADAASATLQVLTLTMQVLPLQVLSGTLVGP